jgi:hypothetical protein
MRDTSLTEPGTLTVHSSKYQDVPMPPDWTELTINCSGVYTHDVLRVRKIRFRDKFYVSLEICRVLTHDIC